MIWSQVQEFWYVFCPLLHPYHIGINAQARKLQKSRSRVNSTLIQRTMGRSQKLWRSRSEMDILDSDTKQCYEQSKTNPEQSPIRSHGDLSEGDGGSQAKKETLCLRGEREVEESEREETESSDDNTTQYFIHPPHDCPYLLLLHGNSPAQVCLLGTRPTCTKTNVSLSPFWQACIHSIPDSLDAKWSQLFVAWTTNGS